MLETTVFPQSGPQPAHGHREVTHAGRHLPEVVLRERFAATRPQLAIAAQSTGEQFPRTREVTHPAVSNSQDPHRVRLTRAIAQRAIAIERLAQQPARGPEIR